GDARMMQRLVRQAQDLGVGIGAHPSFPDRTEFGRKEMHLTPDEVRADLLYQLGALTAIARAESAELAHVKLHGALYNQAARNRELAQIISLTLAEFNPNLKIMALAGSVFVDVLRETGLNVVQEVFADRGYTAQGTLVPRHAEEALITDENDMLAQVLSMVKHGKVRAITGEWVAVKADTVCLHGDGLHAATFARRLHQFLQTEGVMIAKLEP
ncbi:MAG: LamB/YcsF family protein, partial [Neisseriaceae bacterium]|nr:LamB/YcsF family protein [Neisseriaceae bacterium]